MTFFKAEDFNTYGTSGVYHQHITPTEACRMANEKLQREAKVVYGIPFQANCSTGFHEIQSKYDTHKALLVCIEPIEKKSCTHPDVMPCNSGFYYRCTDCGKKLHPTGWKEVVDEQR